MNNKKRKYKGRILPWSLKRRMKKLYGRTFHQLNKENRIFDKYIQSAKIFGAQTSTPAPVFVLGVKLHFNGLKKK